LYHTPEQDHTLVFPRLREAVRMLKQGYARS
jgi:hypothetical protein